MDFQIFKDRQVLLQKSAFDYSGSEISKYFRMIALEIKKSKRISENEINDLISQAVTFNFNYITRPNETIVDFIFKESDSLSPEEMAMILDYPYYYNYLRQILSSYMGKKQLLTLEKKELETMADFFNIGAVLRSQIPPQAIELYLKEKNLNDHLSRLQNALAQSPKIKYEIDEIKKIIYTVVPTEEQKTAASESELTSTEDESLKETKTVDVSEDLKPGINTIVKENLLPDSPTIN